MFVSRFFSAVADGVRWAPSLNSSRDTHCDDQYEIAEDMLCRLDGELPDEFKTDEGLRLYAVFYLANLREAQHATWVDYSRGNIRDRDLAFVVQRAAKESRDRVQSIFLGAYQPDAD